MSSERNDVDLRFAADFKDLRGRVGGGVGGRFVEKWFGSFYGLLPPIAYLIDIFGRFLRSRVKSVAIGIYSAQLERIKGCISARRV